MHTCIQSLGYLLMWWVEQQFKKTFMSYYSPVSWQLSFHAHHHFHKHAWELQEELSKIHSQTHCPFAYYFAICHSPDIEKTHTDLFGKNWNTYPMFQQSALLSSDEKYTNEIELFKCLKKCITYQNINVEPRVQYIYLHILMRNYWTIR